MLWVFCCFHEVIHAYVASRIVLIVLITGMCSASGHYKLQRPSATGVVAVAAPEQLTVLYDKTFPLDSDNKLHVSGAHR